MMLIGRSIQGIGGGFLFALAYAMIRVVFKEALWPRAMALVSGMWGVATLVGPAVGGVFAEWGIWRAAFWSVTLAAMVFALLALGALPSRDHKSSESEGVSIPLIQLACLTLAVIAMSVASTSPNRLRSIVSVVLALMVGMLLIKVEKRSRQKLLPSQVFHRHSKLAALYVMMSLLALTVTSGEVFVPLFLQVLHAQSPLVAGYLAALMAGGWTLGSVVSSGARKRTIERAIQIGPVLGVIGMVSLALFVSENDAGTWLDLAPICLALLVIGLGVGVAWPHLLTLVLKTAPLHEQELAGASITTIQLFATAAGAALAGIVTNAGGLVDPGGVDGTARAARWLFWTFAIAPLLGVFVANRTFAEGPNKPILNRDVE